jgi:acyl-CoA dehydrogenase
LPDDDGLPPFTATLAAALASVGSEPTARALWRALGSGGVIDALYPERPAREAVDPAPARLCALLTELDARYPVGVTLSVCVQVALGLPLMARAAAGGGLAADVAAAARRGEVLLAIAVTDASGAGSDVLGAGTQVKVGAGGLVLSGGKDWIANAAHHDYALVLSRQQEARHFTSFSWVLVPASTPGVSVIPTGGELFTGAGVAHLRFAGVRLPVTHLTGPPHRALAMFARQAGTERLAGALWSRAMCRRVLATTRKWLGARASGGGVLWDNPAIRERFARCLVEWARLDALCQAYMTLPAVTSRDAAAMVLKAAAGDSTDKILAECASLRGADGFRAGGEAMLRCEASMFGIAGGATGAMLAGISGYADELLGVPT